MRVALSLNHDVSERATPIYELRLTSIHEALTWFHSYPLHIAGIQPFPHVHCISLFHHICVVRGQPRSILTPCNVNHKKVTRITIFTQETSKEFWSKILSTEKSQFFIAFLPNHRLFYKTAKVIENLSIRKLLYFHMLTLAFY